MHHFQILDIFVILVFKYGHQTNGEAFPYAGREDLPRFGQPIINEKQYKVALHEHFLFYSKGNVPI